MAGANRCDRLIDAVVWDFDGTLVDSHSTDVATLAALVAEDPEMAAGAGSFWETEGRALRERLELAWPVRAAALLDRFDDARPEPQLFDGAREVVVELERRGVAQAVVSSRRDVPLRRGLRAAGLEAQLAVVVGLEGAARPKPDPEGLLWVLAALGTEPQRTVYVGDLPVDLDAAERAGIPSLLAVWRWPVGAPERRRGHALQTPAEVLLRVGGVGAVRGARG